jgi:hypothetical protein
MERMDLLNSIFESFIEEMKLEKDHLITSIQKNEYDMKRYKNCSRIKTIVAHLFFMAILKNSPLNSNFIDEKHPFVDYIRWNSVFVKPINKNLPFTHIFKKEKSPHDLLKFHSLKMQAKKLFLNSLQNLDAAKCLLLNECFFQSVHYSQLAAELGIKSILKAKNISHALWKCEHSIVHLGNGTRCFDNKFISLCNSLEILGIEQWKNVDYEKSSTLSIRSRYCDYDDDAYFFLDTFPNIVFDSKLAKEAYALSKEILCFCENVLSSIFKNYN